MKFNVKLPLLVMRVGTQQIRLEILTNLCGSYDVVPRHFSPNTFVWVGRVYFGECDHYTFGGIWKACANKKAVVGVPLPPNNKKSHRMGPTSLYLGFDLPKTKQMNRS
jgi:hypothetical protein